MTLLVVATGGTIASVADPRTGVVRAAVSPDELVARVPALKQYGPLQVEEVARVNGWNVTSDTMLTVAEVVERGLARSDVRGALVTHGTDTVEETAFLLDLVVPSDKPVACVVAMRSGDQSGADGPRNLTAAAAAVVDLRLRGYGVTICADGELHAARWARKVHTLRTNAFASPGHGPLARAAPNGLRALVQRPDPVHIPHPRTSLPVVPVLATYPGVDPDVLTAVLTSTAARGLVVEGTGLGNLPGSLTAGIEAAIGSGVVVVVSTRVLAGGTAPVYGGPGGAATLTGLGAVLAGQLSTGKARLLLSLLLASPSSPAAVANEFVEKAAELA